MEKPKTLDEARTLASETAAEVFADCEGMSDKASREKARQAYDQVIDEYQRRANAESQAWWLGRYRVI